MVYGSPPRAWGALQLSAYAVRQLRFTPTRVGSTVAAMATASVTSGSPPRAWGARSTHGRQSAPGRFTPTRVGSTSMTRANNTLRTVHPHARGEHFNL